MLPIGKELISVHRTFHYTKHPKWSLYWGSTVLSKGLIINLKNTAPYTKSMIMPSHLQFCCCSCHLRCVNLHPPNTQGAHGGFPERWLQAVLLHEPCHGRGEEAAAPQHQEQVYGVLCGRGPDPGRPSGAGAQLPQDLLPFSTARGRDHQVSLWAPSRSLVGMHGWTSDL